MKVIKSIFIGNRFNVLEVALTSFTNSLNFVEIYVLKDSLLEEECNQKKIAHKKFTLKDKELIINEISNHEFDLLISNGCPFKLPISNIEKPSQRYINIHPSYLPFLKGKTSINGVFYNEMDFFGATMHYMDDEIDTGAIIHQIKVETTEDIDLPLLYYMSFRLEAEVFKDGFERVLDNDKGVLQEKNTGSYFDRISKLQELNFEMSTKEMLKSIKAFGIKTQGCQMIIKEKGLTIFKASEIYNQTILNWFSDAKVGSILLELNEHLYLKTKNGIIKIEDYKWNV